MASQQDDHLWALVHAERAALAEDLTDLDAEQWRHDTLCGQWDVEEVVAHLIAAASLGRWRWLRSMIGARFRPDVHNQRRIVEYRGSTLAETLGRFREVIGSTTAPSGDGPLLHHIGLYTYKRAALEAFVASPPAALEKRERLEQLRALALGMRIDIAVVDTVPLGVDTPEDLEIARQILKK
jgi:hypothetical protein